MAAHPDPFPWRTPCLAALLVWAGLLGGFSAAQAIDNDQGLFYLAALRVAQGQVFMVDFGMPYAYFTVQVLAFFIWLAPTSGWGLVLASGALNLAAVWVVFLLIGRTGAGRWATLAGAWLTSLGFLAIGGMYYNDQFAYFFVFLAGLVFTAHWRLGVKCLLTSFCLIVAFYAKQTVGLAGAAGLGAAWLLTSGWRRASFQTALYLIGSYLLGHLLLLGWVYFFLDFELFNFFYFDLPRDYKADLSIWEVAKAFLFPLRIDPIQMLAERGLGRLLLYPFVLLCYYAYFLIGTKNLGPVSRPPNPNFRFLLIYGLVSSLIGNGLIGRGNLELNLGLGMVAALVLATVSRPWLRDSGLILFTAILVLFIFRNRRLAEPSNAQQLADSELRPLVLRRLFAQKDDSLFHALNREVYDFLRAQPVGYTLATVDRIGYLVPLALGNAPVVMTTDYLHAFHYLPVASPLRTYAEADLIRRYKQFQPDFVLTTVRQPNDPEGFQPGALARFDAYLVQHYHSVYLHNYYQVLARKK